MESGASDVPDSVPPEVHGNTEGFDTTDILGAPVPVAGIAGEGPPRLVRPTDSCRALLWRG